MSRNNCGTILVVDDEQAVGELAKLLLTMLGWAVTVATDPRQALELFRPGVFDVVLVDYSMPRMRGDELIAAMRLRAPMQRVILTSGFLDFAMPPNTRFLAKPFTVQELQTALTATQSYSGTVFWRGSSNSEGTVSSKPVTISQAASSS